MRNHALQHLQKCKGAPNKTRNTCARTRSFQHAYLHIGLSIVLIALGHRKQSTHLPQPGVKPGASAPNRFYMYGVVGRLAMLAASYELEATDPDAEIYD